VTAGVHHVMRDSVDHFVIACLDVAPPERWSSADVVVTGAAADDVFRSLPGCSVVLRGTGVGEWEARSRHGRRISLRFTGSAVWCAAVAYVLLSRPDCGGTSVTASSLVLSPTALGSPSWTYRSSAPA
jgi:hypothetical protein